MRSKKANQLNNNKVVQLASGFTLIELLMTIAIAAILLGIGLPSLQVLLSNNRLTATTNDLAGSVNLARSEAIKRGGSVRIVPTVLGSWSDGWRVVADTNRDGDFTDEVDILHRSESTINAIQIAGTGTHSLSAGHLEFGRRGEVVPVTDVFSVNLKTDACKTKYMRALNVSVSGSVAVTQPECI